jgi:hypothetical protein
MIKLAKLTYVANWSNLAEQGFEKSSSKKVFVDLPSDSVLRLDLVRSRVARWYIFKPKIPIWVFIGGPWNGKCLYILQSFGRHSLCIWYILCSFGIFFPVLVCCTKKNLAPLVRSCIRFSIRQLRVFEVPATDAINFLGPQFSAKIATQKMGLDIGNENKLMITFCDLKC